MNEKITFEQNGNGTMVRTDNGLSLNVPSKMSECMYAGKMLGVFKQQTTEWHLVGCFDRAIDLLHSVFNTSSEHCKKARGQIEDSGGNVSMLSDLDVNVINVLVREKLAETAREIDDPFNPTVRKGSVYTFHLVEGCDLQSMFEGTFK